MNKLFTELRRRNIFRVAGVYAVVGWVLAQIVALAANSFGAPEWVMKMIIVVLIIGFPIAILLAWAFEMTPEGMKRTENVSDDESITAKTGRKLDFAILAGLILVIMFVAGNRLMPQKTAAPEIIQQAQTDETDTAIEEASIAVLPFADLSPNADQEYFSDGMAEEILNVLVRVDNLKVASRTSSFGFKGQEALGIPAIAKKLNVRHVLEGSVRKSGETVRITAQLIDASNDKHLWSQTYDRKLSVENIFAIQDEIANEIVKQLGIALDGSKLGAPVVLVKADTKNLNAYELYLKANEKFLVRSDIADTITLFEQAVAADPGFARAYAGLAAVYAVAPSWGVVDRDYVLLANETANKAINLNPDLALPYAVRGLMLRNAPPINFNESLKYFEEAIKRDPKETSAWLWRGILYNAVGYFDKAEQDFLRCLDADPAYEMCRRYMALSVLYVGETKRALELFEQGTLKGNGVGFNIFLNVYAAQGNASTVLLYLYQANEDPNKTHFIELNYRAFMDPSFDFEKERITIEVAYVRANGEPLDWDSERGRFLSFYYGNYANETISNIYNAIWWQAYPLKLKNSPHRKRWMREVGLPEFWREHGFPPQCRAVGADDFECD